MGGEQIACLDFFAKEWNPVFSTERNLKQDRPWKERKDAEMGDVRGDEDALSEFLFDCEDSIGEFSIEELKEFVLGIARLHDLVNGIGSAGEQRGAWFDQKTWISEKSLEGSSGDAGVREKPDDKEERVTTATGIYRNLKKKLADEEETPKPTRLLLLFRNLNPNYILALAETGLFQEINLLRDAVWKHIAFQTSIRVKLPSGFSIFQMEIHLPSYELRTHPLHEKPPPEPVERSPRQWTDLSFLEIHAQNSAEAVAYGMREAHFTMTICGSENRRWTAYSFVDSRADDEDLGEQVGAYGLQKDPISAGVLDADIPIWDPREYFLMILKYRLAASLKEWQSLIRTIERSIKQYKRSHTSTLSNDTARQPDDAKKSFDWTRQTMELLSLLQQKLFGIITTWNTFSSASGDIGYFAEFKDVSQKSNLSARIALREIQEIMETMEVLNKVLTALEKDCRDSAEVLHLRLTLEANNAVQNNGLFAQFTMSIISPIVIAISYYSIPEEIAPFKLDAKYFYPAIFFVIAIMQILFFAFSTRPWWWKKAIAWVIGLYPDIEKLQGAWTRERLKEDRHIAA